TRKHARTSLPSTTNPGIPYPSARLATSATAICLDCGTLIAYSLFSQMNTTGRRWIEAMFRPSCQSPSLVAPSPNQLATTPSSLRYFMALAIPDACGTCVEIGEEWYTIQ